MLCSSVTLPFNLIPPTLICGIIWKGVNYVELLTLKSNDHWQICCQAISKLVFMKLTVENVRLSWTNPSTITVAISTKPPLSTQITNA